MKTITYNDLIELIRALKGAQPVGIEAITDARARKTGNPYGGIRKHSKAVGFVGVRYEDSVAREQVRQGVDPFKNEFIAEAPRGRKWLIANKILISDDGTKYYLRTQSTPGQRNRQRAKVIGYIGELGQSLTHDQVAPFLPASNASKKQAEHGLDKVGEQIDVRDYLFTSIQSIRIGGKRYALTP